MPYENNHSNSNNIKKKSQNSSSRIEQAIMSTFQKFNLKKRESDISDSKHEFQIKNKSNIASVKTRDTLISGVFNQNTGLGNLDTYRPSGILANLNTQKSQKFIEDFFNDVINILNVNVAVSVRFTGTSFMVSLIGDDANVFIGTHGSVLYAYQHIINLLLKKHDSPKVFLNASNYREERKESLSRYALSCARKVLHTGIKFVFEPMNSFDRLVIHETLRDFAGVVTHTEGTEDSKYVSIELAPNKKIGSIN